MKTVRKNRQVRKTKTRRHRMRSQKKVVGGVNWKFWEKSKSTDDPAAPAAAAPTAAADSAPSAPSAPAPEPVPQCPPCPVCDSTVHLPADQMPAAAAAAQSGGRRRRSRKSRNATKKCGINSGARVFKSDKKIKKKIKKLNIIFY